MKAGTKKYNKYTWGQTLSSGKINDQQAFLTEFAGGKSKIFFVAHISLIVHFFTWSNNRNSSTKLIKPFVLACEFFSYTKIVESEERSSVYI